MNGVNFRYEKYMNEWVSALATRSNDILRMIDIWKRFSDIVQGYNVHSNATFIRSS